MASKATLRRKPISKGRESLYLDFYPPIREPETMKLVYKEFLNIYIYKTPENVVQRRYNEEMLEKAEAIRCMRVQSLINEEYGFLDKQKMKGDFLAYFVLKAENKDQKWTKVYQHFFNFVKGKCAFNEVTVELCRNFGEYLLTAKKLKHPDITISHNSAAGYFSTFRALLKIAFRDKMIRENINEYLDKIEYEDTKKNI